MIINTLKTHKLSIFILSLIIGIQIIGSLPRLNEPLIDGRLHWYFDNGLFLKLATHSNDDTQRSWKKAFGVTSYQYDAHNNVTGMSHYQNHPVLMPTLFKIYTQVVGSNDRAPRSFALILSLISTVMVFAIFRLTVGNPALSGGLTLLYCLLPLKWTYMDQFKYENISELLIIASIFALIQLREWKYGKQAFLIALFFLFQTDWTAYMPGAIILGYLFLNRRSEEYQDILKPALITATTSFLVTLGIQYQLGFTPSAIYKTFLYRSGMDVQNISWSVWAGKQWIFIKMNFGVGNTLLGISCFLISLVNKLWKKHDLSFFGITLFIVSLVYIGVLRNQSFIHHYVQWTLMISYLLLLGGLIRAYQKSDNTIINKSSIAIVMSIMILATWSDASQTLLSFKQSTYGTAEDMKVIQEIGKRVLYFDNGISGPPGWWSGPIVGIYTDPIYSKGVNSLAKNITTLKGAINTETDVIVRMRSQNALVPFKKAAVKRLGQKTLSVYKLSPTFVFYKVNN
ncbi:hypothetical protein HOH87_07480 [bacterium]|jgi:hypothetical protein|nr:hypothetical protein [bacterium]